MPDKGNATQKKPNILAIWGDDIGISNLSCYSFNRWQGGQSRERVVKRRGSIHSDENIISSA